MTRETAVCLPPRREFLMHLMATGAAVCLWPGKALAQPLPRDTGAPVPAFDFQYRTVSVKHLPEIKSWMDKLIKEKKVSDHPTFRKYISDFKYEAGEKMPKARSIVVAAYKLRPSSVGFHQNGKKYLLIIPPGYADDGVPPKTVQETIAKQALGDPKAKLLMGAVPVKTLAVRSGLAEYGLNNITFVEKFGSFHQLVPFFTEQELEDHWGPLKTLRLCKGCTICIKGCPTGAISEKNFVIDVGRCISLYNELPDPFPTWLDPKVHHTMVGCMKCQAPCPANQDVMRDITHLCDIDEEETALLVSGRRDPKIEQSIITKLKWFPAAKDIPYLSRNVKLALANTPSI